MKTKVVIIGHGYTSRLGIIRSLAELDCEITVIAMVFNGPIGRFIRGNGGKPIDCCSKYVNRVLFCNVTDGEGLIQLLLNKCTDNDQKVILIPDSDFSAAVIDNNLDRLKDWFLCPNIRNKAGMVEHWMDKTVQKELAKRLGLNVAEGRIVTVKDKHYSFPSGVEYPCFTKALATISGGKQFLRRCDDEAALRRLLDKVAQRFDTEVLIEDYKHIDKEYAVVGFSDGSSVFIPGVIEFIVNSRSHFGIAREGKIRPNDGFEPLLEKFKEVVRQIGFYGLFDIDFYESNDRFYFGEINLRFGGSGYSYTAMGVNLPAIFVRSLIGESISSYPKEVSTEATFVNERMCIDDYLLGYLTEAECKSIIERSDIRFVYNSIDMAPNRKLEREYGIIRLKRFRRNLINKCHKIGVKK